MCFILFERIGGVNVDTKKMGRMLSICKSCMHGSNLLLITSHGNETLILNVLFLSPTILHS